MGGFAHILIGIDLTDRSERALERAAQLGREGRAERLTLLHVVAAGLPPILATQQQNAAEIFLATKIAQFPAVGVCPHLLAPSSAVGNRSAPSLAKRSPERQTSSSSASREEPLCAEHRRHHGGTRNPI